MRIIEAISDTNIGGAGILLVNRLKHTDREKYKTTVLIPKDSRLCQRLADIKVDFVEIDGCRDRSFELSALPQYIREIKKIHPQIINSHGCMTSRVAAYLCRVPVRICTRHCVFPISPKGGHGYIYMRLWRGDLPPSISPFPSPFHFLFPFPFLWVSRFRNQWFSPWHTQWFRGRTA